MPNWCFTDVTFKGEKENIDALEKYLNRFEKEEEEKLRLYKRKLSKIRPRLNNYRQKLGLHVDWEKKSLPLVTWNDDNRVRNLYYHLTKGQDGIIDKWSGYFLLSLGAVPSKGFLNHIANTHSCIRGGLQDWDRIDDESLYMTFMDAWYPKLAVLDLIAHRFNLEYVFTAEEPGCEVFINTDDDGEYYDSRISISNYYDVDSLQSTAYSDSIVSALADYGNEGLNKLLELSKSEKARYYKNTIGELLDDESEESWNHNVKQIEEFEKSLNSLSDDFDKENIVSREEFLKEIIENMGFQVTEYTSDYCRCDIPAVIQYIEEGTYRIPTTYSTFEEAKQARRIARRKARLRRKRKMRR